jgi:hypothetical protein
MIKLQMKDSLDIGRYHGRFGDMDLRMNRNDANQFAGDAAEAAAQGFLRGLLPRWLRGA